MTSSGKASITSPPCHCPFQSFPGKRVLAERSEPLPYEKHHTVELPAQRRYMLRLLATASLLTLGLAASAANNFVTVILPKGVSLELPRNWTVLSANQRVTLDTSVQSRLDLSNVQAPPSELAFAANYYDDRGRTLAMLNLRYYPELGLSQAQAHALTSEHLREIDSALKQTITKENQALGISITFWNGTRKTEINGITALVTEYGRPSLRGPGDFRVRLVRVLAGSESFTLTVSHLESAAFLLQPITDRIINSLRLASVPLPSERSESFSAMSKLYGEQWVIVLIISFFWTWGVGLAPAVLIRFAIMRRPVTKLSAVFIVTVWWTVMLVLGQVLGSESKSRTALVLVAIASYVILRKGGRQPRRPPEAA